MQTVLSTFVSENRHRVDALIANFTAMEAALVDLARWLAEPPGAIPHPNPQPYRFLGCITIFRFVTYLNPQPTSPQPSTQLAHLSPPPSPTRKHAPRATAPVMSRRGESRTRARHGLSLIWRARNGLSLIWRARHGLSLIWRARHGLSLIWPAPPRVPRSLRRLDRRRPLHTACPIHRVPRARARRLRPGGGCLAEAAGARGAARGGRGERRQRP